MDKLLAILGYVGSLGLGAFLGILVKHFLDKNLKNRELLFHARRAAYSAVLGRLNNFFLEKDTRGLPSPELAAELNTFFSAAYLLAGAALVEQLDQYSPKLVEFHEALDRARAIAGDKESDDSARLHSEVSAIAAKISKLMRAELGIG